MSVRSMCRGLVIAIAVVRPGITMADVAQVKICLEEHALGLIEGAPRVSETVPNAEDLLRQLGSYFGLNRDISILSCGIVEKVEAWAASPADLSDGLRRAEVRPGRYIVYNPTWVREVIGNDRDQAIFVFGHEYGHFLSGHFFERRNIDRIDKESEADRFGGCANARMQSNWSSVVNLVSRIRPEVTDGYYPSAKDSLSIVEEGFKGCGGVVPVEKTPPKAVPTAVPTITVTREPFQDCGNCPLMVAVQADTFIMGSPQNEEVRALHEGPPRTVAIPEFALGQYEVTFGEWDACVHSGGCDGYTPSDSNWGRGRRPVINVSWEDAQAYVTWLSEVTGQPYRLLSEAEWEYAARAGTTTRYSWGDDPPTPEQANFGRNVGMTTKVGVYPPNPWGLHDMHGNVWEWVEDCWNASYQGAPRDGSAWTWSECRSRVLRGGAWDIGPGFLRSAYRSMNDPIDRFNAIGFRVARTLSRSESITP